MSELIYGRRAVLETLRAARRHVYRLWLEEGSRARGTGTLQDIVDLAEKDSIPTRVVRGGLFDRLANQQANAQGVALEVGAYPYAALENILERPHTGATTGTELPPLILILDHIQDPQNLGPLFRTAEAMALDGILIPERRAAGITPAVVNASAGAVEYLDVARVTNLNRAIEDLKGEDFWVAGLDDGADAREPDPSMLNGPLAVVIGSEGAGMSRLTHDKCDFLVRLPMYGRVESLNAAVAGSIMLYLVRQAQRTGS